jgi:glycosyltransferase involved in cell wall biosynthesis
MTDMTMISELQAEGMNSRRRPLVSAVLAVRNEECHIQAVLKSLLHQETSNFELEIIIVDGDSSDATQEIVERIATGDSRVKLAINKQKKTPYAFNLGIQIAQGEYICILGAHTTYAKDYIATCLEELKLQGAGGCSGREVVRPGGGGLQAQLVAWTLAHPFGTSTGSMRTRGAGFADTIPYPIFLKSTLLEVGGYDTQLHRNQDNDLSQKLRARGYKLYITDKTSCEYCVSPNLVSLSRYALKTGFWNIISFRRNPSSMAMRHFVPGAFVVVLFLSLLLFLFSTDTTGDLRLWLRSPLLLLGAIYGTASIAAACHVSLREKSVGALLLPIIFLLLHVSYGVGTLSAIVSNARPPSSELSHDRDVAEYS